MSLFEIKKITLPDEERPPLSFQRKRWLKEFLKAFLVVFFCYMAMYLLRYNFKAAQPLLKEQYGISTTDLGYIGLTFSMIYGIGKVVSGYLVAGKNTKKILSVLLICSALISIMMGFVLTVFSAVVGFFLILWGLNGAFQSGGASSAYSTIYRWTPRNKRATSIGCWNMSYNIGGAIAGAVSLWGAKTFFNWHLAGMFIFPALIALTIGVIGYFWGKDDPEELGWNRAEEIFGEPIEEENIVAETMTRWEIFKTYLLCNPWVWVLCCTNVLGYILRIGVDNWAPLYVWETLRPDDYSVVNTILYFDIGSLFGNIVWSIVADYLKGRTAAVGVFCLILVFFAIGFYKEGASVREVDIAVFTLGFAISGTLILLHLSLINLVPKKSVSVAFGMVGTFGYLFGDSTAKVGLAAIADPQKNGLTVFGYHLHGWESVFTVFYVACLMAMVLLFLVAMVEERKIRAIEKAKREHLKVAKV